MSTPIKEQELFDVPLSPPEIFIEAQNASEITLPQKSKVRYLAVYETFIQWKTNRNLHSFSEKVFLTYFNELAKKYSPTSLWSFYSMLKSTVLTKHEIDIKSYSKLTEFLKRRAEGYTSRKSKYLSLADVEKFLKEAPDNQYLATKVALIFGITGACRRNELNDITTKDVETHGDMLLVKIPNTRNKIPRTFTIDGPFYDIVKKYQALRPSNVKNYRFFLNYQKGKCTVQPIGINKFGAMPREIAKYLGLPDADMYTGHSFRRTSATLLGDSGITILKRHIKKLSDTEVASHKANIRAKIISEINSEPETKKFCPEKQQSSSHDSDFSMSPARSDTDNDPLHVLHSFNSYENIKSSTSPTFPSENDNSETINNTNTITQSVNMPTKTIHYHFQNCTFTNCFN